MGFGFSGTAPFMTVEFLAEELWNPLVKMMNRQKSTCLYQSYRGKREALVMTL